MTKSVEDSQETVSFGPNLFYIGGTILACPFTWLAGIEALFHYSIVARTLLWQAAGLIGANEKVLQFLYWLRMKPIPLWIVLLLVAAIYSIIRFSTSSFRITGSGDLMVNTGLLGLKTTGGPFVCYDNTIPAELIVDVNVSRNLIQLVLGTGTLVVSFSEFIGRSTVTMTIRLPYVNDPEVLRKKLMSRSGVKNARYYV